ncbi:hypothetical protein BDF19DRAFT_204599 [Syncephalis fuscata]|nr:hypothetical protein BDF19DRAFT_204599 [Syncephalis fuscata]
MWLESWKGATVQLVLAVAALGQFGSVHAFYGKKSAVKLVTANNFNEVVYKSNGVVLLEFFAPWCGHCQQLAPKYSSAAKQLKNQVIVAAMDCDTEENKQFCGMQGVSGFPTIKIYYPLQDKKSKKKSLIKKSSIDYQGPREVEALVQAGLDRLPNWSTTLLTSGKSTIARSNIDLFLKDEDSFLANLPAGLPKAILLTDKSKVAPLMQTLALELYGRLRLGVSRDKKVIQRYGINKTPALLILSDSTSEFDEPIIYQDKLVYSKLLAFLEEHAAPAKSDKSNKKQKQASKEKKQKNKKDNKAKKEKKTTYESKSFEKTETNTNTDVVISIESQADMDRCMDSRRNSCLLVLLDEVDPSDEEQVKADQEYIDILQTILENDREAKGPFEFGYIRAPNDGIIARRLELPARRPLAVGMQWNSRDYLVLEADQPFSVHSVELLMTLLVSKRADNLQALALRPEFGPILSKQEKAKKQKKQSDKDMDEHDEL